jgi:hypothetical protein
VPTTAIVSPERPADGGCQVHRSAPSAADTPMIVVVPPLQATAATSTSGA